MDFRLELVVANEDTKPELVESVEPPSPSEYAETVLLVPNKRKGETSPTEIRLKRQSRITAEKQINSMLDEDEQNEDKNDESYNHKTDSSSSGGGSDTESDFDNEQDIQMETDEK
jgi:hypothetical protein